MKRRSERLLDVRADTRVAMSVLLQRLYEDSRSDREFKIFTDKCEQFVT